MGDWRIGQDPTLRALVFNQVLYRLSYRSIHRVPTGVADGIQTHNDWGHVPAR